jgi:TetR/AcrR family transcriptional regulator of autoinduction and epiphytic fitness
MAAALSVPRPSTRAKQARTISAAQRLFLERGYLGTSMDAVAQEAGISKQTLYVYYPGKAELFAAVLRELTVERSGQPLELPPELARPGDLEFLRRALREVLDRIAWAMFQPEYIALLRVIIAEVPRAPDLGELFRAEVPDRTIKLIADVLAAAAAAGLVRMTDPTHAAMLLVGPLVLRVVRDALLVPPGAMTAPAADHLDQVVDVFLLGVTPRSDASRFHAATRTAHPSSARRR